MGVPYADKNLRDWDAASVKAVNQGEDASLMNTTSADVNAGRGDNPQKEYVTGSGKPSGPMGANGRE